MIGTKLKRMITMLLVTAMVAMPLPVLATEDTGSDTTQWTANDFTYGDWDIGEEEKIAPSDDSDNYLQVKVHVVTGLSDSGKEKLKTNTDLVIPAEDSEGNKVQGVGAEAFSNEDFTSVTFPENVKTELKVEDFHQGKIWKTNREITERGDFFIGSGAFSGCSLSELTLPEGTLYLGYGAFFMSKDLTKVTLPSTLMKVENMCFTMAESLSEVTFAETTDFPMVIEWIAFSGVNFTSVWLPDNTQKVSGGAFSNKEGTMLNVFIRKSEYYTEDNFEPDTGQTFYLGTDIPDVEWAKLSWRGYHFTYSEDDASEITGLSGSGTIKLSNGDTDLPIPAQNEDGKTITSIGKDAFREKAFTKVTVPDSITSIGEGAFATSSDAKTAECIKSAKLPSSLTEIAPKLFENQLLTEIDIPSGVTTIGESAFSGNPLKTLTLPKGVTAIGKESFLNHQLQEITIPASVKTIGESAFARNTVPRNCTVQKITLSEGLESIGAKAFSQALTSACTTIDLPTTLTSLDSTAFDGSKSKVTLYSKVADQAKGAGEYENVDTDSSAYKIIYLPKVIFDAAGGSCDTSEVRLDRDRKLSQLPEATRVGYAFDGWYTEAQGGDPVKAGDDSAEYTEDTTLYAHWTKTSQDVTPTVTLSAGTYVYDGKVKTPAVTVKVDGQTVDKDSYDVSYAAGRTNVGTYKVMVVMKGKYEGSGSATFKINPKGTSLKKLKKAKKALTATWKKQTAQTTGYQVQYATAQNFKSVKTKTVTSNKKVSLTVKKLKSKKKYYVRIRTYKTVSGTKYYSAWSGARSIKTK